MKRVSLKAGVGRLVCLLAAAAMLPAAPGCGPSGPTMGRVSGNVTYKGKPVPMGTITFVPVEAGGRNATGEIDSQGNYTLQTENPKDGAQVGEYKVTVYAHEEPILDYIPQTPVKPKILTPQKYEQVETSDLKATVKSGSNTINFDLKD